MDPRLDVESAKATRGRKSSSPGWSRPSISHGTEAHRKCISMLNQEAEARKANIARLRARIPQSRESSLSRPTTASSIQEQLQDDSLQQHEPDANEQMRQQIEQLKSRLQQEEEARQRESKAATELKEQLDAKEQELLNKHLDLKNAQMAIKKLEEHVGEIGAAQAVPEPAQPANAHSEVAGAAGGASRTPKCAWDPWKDDLGDELADEQAGQGCSKKKGFTKDDPRWLELFIKLRASVNPAGHFFVSMCDITTVAVDYWWVSCREIDVRSIGLPSQTLKRIWLAGWLKSGALEMPNNGIGNCELEKLAKIVVPTPPVTKAQLDRAANDLATKFENTMKNSRITEIQKEAFKQEFEEAVSNMEVRQEEANALKPEDIVETPQAEHFTVGRLKGLPSEVTKLGEPVLCNIIPGDMERQYVEAVRTVDFESRIQELKMLISTWVETVMDIFKQEGKPPKCGRVKPLLAMPLIGTGGAGGVHLTGLIADMMVDLLPQLAHQYGVDILLCLSNQKDHMLMQERRKSQMYAWSQLTDSNMMRARILAGFAKKRHLCFFIGAGMSIPAGLPRWGRLLELIDEDLGFPLSKGRDKESIWEGIKEVKQEFKDSGKVVERDGGTWAWRESGKPWDDFLEIAEELHRTAPSTSEFKKVVAKYCDSPKHAIGHSLLACMPARSSITTNYDTLFEKASNGVNAFGGRQYSYDKMAVLPFAPKKECNRWLLKMHGCCSHTDDIVLTAEDYEKYETSGQAALGGLVQAELMTSHMMFVGFSMTDANFMRLIKSVTDAYGGESREGAGTIIAVGKLDKGIKNKFRQYGIMTETIGGNLDWNQYDPNNLANTNPAREMEVFMDYLGMHSTDTAYPIFDSSFETALKDGEKSLQKHLDNMLKSTPQDAMSAHAWGKVKDLCEGLGVKSIPDGLPPAGHLFVSMTDITTVACDHWLIPCREIDVSSVGLAAQTMKKIWLSSWIKSGVLSMPDDTIGDCILDKLCWDDCVPNPPQVGKFRGYTVGRLKGLPTEVVEKGEPILCNIVPGDLKRPDLEKARTEGLDKRVEELAHLLTNWVHTTVEIFKREGKPPKCGRVKPLLAVPLIGTGGAGGVLVTGLIADMMVDLLPRLADQKGVDILICLAHLDDFMLVQQRRKARVCTWSVLTHENKKDAKELAGFAKKRHLCYFIGAGMSIPAGLPRWGRLLELIDEDLGFPLSKGRDKESIWEGIKEVKQEFKDSGKVVERDGGTWAWRESGKPWDDFLEIAEELHRTAPSTSEFKKVVAKYCDSPKHAIGHSLLACTPARSSITTNYDTLFEKACHGVDAFGLRPYGPDKMAVLPFAPKKECNRWLLKMHGCCSHTDDIVLTAEDYEKYETSGQAALGGLVQAELMTSHMMFVGFSMTDANFMRLIKSVTDAYKGEKREGAGTIISVGKLDKGIKEKFAEYGIKTTAIAEELDWNQYSPDMKYTSNPAREMEVWMDYLVLECTDTAYPIFEEKFETALTHNEKALRDHLTKFLNGLPHEVVTAPAWEKVRGLYQNLGSSSTRLDTEDNEISARWSKILALSTNLRKLLEDNTLRRSESKSKLNIK